MINERATTVRRPQSNRHPATFSWAVCSAIIDVLGPLPVARVLDPFAGTGRVHVIADLLGAESVGVEIEPEWAAMSERTIAADARSITREMVGYFDTVITSPTYGNRMADKHNARDPSDRATYRHRLGRELTPGNSGGMQWGNPYKRLHLDVYTRVADLLTPGGVFVLNVKDHVRGGVRMPVSAWHVSTLVACGLIHVRSVSVATRGLGGSAGANAAERAGVEHVVLLQKAL